MGTIDSWSSIETIIRQRLDLNELDRRYCAVCGRQDASLSRCFGCQMVYYCGEEHQIEDWTEAHAQKCAQLEWVALGEFIQALPAQPPLPNLGDKWSLSVKEIHNWKSWFSIRTNIVNLANNTAGVFKNLTHLTDKRQPTYQNAIDGLLAAVTDLLTHVLTIGKAIVSFGLQPNIRPLVIHILSGFNKIDLGTNDPSSSNLPVRFHELLNMFPDNKGVELVIMIGDDDSDQSILPHAKLKPDRLIITTTGKGRLLDTSEDKRLQRSAADLLVYFNATHLFSYANKELLKSMLTRQKPTLLTFEDEEEFNEAKACLIAKGVHIHQAGTNQFSSLIIRQRLNRPNATYSTNSYQILLNTMTINGTVERNDENCSLLSRHRSHQSSVGIQHGHTPVHHLQQLNPGLKQVNGKIHIESLSSSSSLSSSHNTHANNNGTPLDTNVHIVSTTNTTTTNTTVQPLVRTNNNIHQPCIVQRRHPSPPVTTSASSVVTATTYKETRPTTTAMMTAVELTRNDHRPQPKPRLSLVKPTNKDIEIPPANVSIVQRIKPFFEQPSIIPSPEPKFIKQQRQPISIPYTYQIANPTKATCLDDVIPSKKIYITSPPVPPPPSTETYINERTMTMDKVIPFSASMEIRHEQRPTITTTFSANQMPRSLTEQRIEESTIRSTANNISSPSIIPIEIHRDQRSTMHTITTSNNSPSLASASSSSTSSIEKRSNERIIPAVENKISPVRVPPTETDIDQPIMPPVTIPTPLPPRVPLQSPPPPLPPPPTTTTTTTSTTSTNDEVIYTEVMKSHERPLSLHHIDLVKSPISPSRSFIVPKQSSSILSKESAYNFQRPSRASAPTNFSYQTTKSRPVQSMMTADRISLYSQRSNKQADVGVTIKNLSECIDRVGIVFDETNRPHDTPSVGLTTVDLIREQLTTSSMSKPTGSLLDKLHKSNSSTRLSTSSSSRVSTNNATPRSKSQQAPRIPHESPSVSKIIPITPPSIRRPVGIFLPLTTKNTQESEQITPIGSEQSSTLVYQNLEPHHSSTNDSTSSASLPQTLDYTLKQPTGPICNGIPKPFRKPTAIIEPSPVITPTITNTTEPNYINLIPQNEHIYTNETNNPFIASSSSNSNSYTSKASSVYSTSDKQNLKTPPEPHYAVTNVPPVPQEPSADYDSFDDELVIDDVAKMERQLHSNDNTDEDSFDDDENHLPSQSIPSKNPSTNFFRSTLNRLTRSNKSLERLNSEPTANDLTPESNPLNIIDTKTKKTLRSIKARHEAKKTGNLLSPYTGDDDTTSIDSNCSTQTATSLNKTSTKSSHHRFRLFRRKIEKDFASDTEAEKHQTEQRRKKWNKKLVNQTANELKTKRLLMMSDDDDEEHNLHLAQPNINHDETHIYDHIIHDETTNNSSRMGKLSNETQFKAPTLTLDEIRSEIQAEIAARQDTQITNQSMTSSNLTLQKKRSKSVTFLDELLSDDSKQKQSNLITKKDLHIKPSTTTKRIEKGDARSICGALTGTGPIRGIIKAANNDITGTTAPVSPSAAAAIYLSGATMDTRCTSPKANDRSQRPLSTYTVGSARFYDGTSASSTPAPPPPPPPPPPPTHSFHQTNNVSTHRPILNNNSDHPTSDNIHPKRPTAKVSPFQTKCPTDASSSPIITNKQTITSSSISKKPMRPSINRNNQTSYDPPNVATSSISDSVGGVSKRLQSNF